MKYKDFAENIYCMLLPEYMKFIALVASESGLRVFAETFFVVIIQSCFAVNLRLLKCFIKQI